MKFVIVGTGRCGTNYMSRLLTDAGLPCGHETIYSVNGIIAKSKNKLVGDSSWLAVPHLSKLKGKGTIIVHIVREPLKVFRSWLFDQNNVISLKPTNIESPYNDYMREAYPSLDKQTTQVDKAIVYYLECNAAIVNYCKESALTYYFFRVEDDPTSLITLLGGNVVKYKHLNKSNSRDRGIAGDSEVLIELRKSKYFNELADVLIGYYPELYTKNTLLGE